MSQHVPSHDLDAEMYVLSAMMLSGNVIDTVQEHVAASDFYRSSHGVMFDAMIAMHDKQVPVEAASVANELERLGKLEGVGGKAKVHELAVWASAAGNAAHYAKIVKDHGILRGLHTAGQEIVRLGNEAPGTVDDLLHKAEQALSGVTMSQRSVRAVSITDGFDDYVAELRDLVTTGIPKTGLLTGFAPLDAITMGMWPGQLIILAARPGQGKSTLAFNICENLADRSIPSLFVSLEMARRELQERAVSRAARVDSYRLRDGKMEPAEKLRMPTGIAKVVARENTLFVDDDGSITLAGLKAEAVRMHRQHGIKLLVVDYLQLMTPPKAENRNLEISEISRGLKLLARRLDIPIIAVAQMSRAIEMRGGDAKRPQLSDLRDSGSLEQDADVVVFLHDPSAYEIDTESDGTTTLIVAKNRKGRTDDAKIGYVPKFSAFMGFPDGPAPAAEEAAA